MESDDGAVSVQSGLDSRDSPLYSVHGDRPKQKYGSLHQTLRVSSELVRIGSLAENRQLHDMNTKQKTNLNPQYGWFVGTAATRPYPTLDTGVVP